MKVRLADTLFPSKKAVKEHMRLLVEMNKDGTPFYDDELYSLLLRHREAEQKIGCGVKAFRVVHHLKYDNFGFVLTRIDGTETDFSWVVCLDGRTPEQDARRAARADIKGQIMSYKTAYFSKHSVCEATGARLTHDSCHVDHESPTFEELFTNWLESQGIGPEEVKVNTTEDMSVEYTIQDPVLRQSWQTYHQLFASLRAVTPGFNLRRSKHG